MPKNKNVLVTGGAGYIGSHTCKTLKSQNFNPITYDDLSSGRKEFVKWGPLVVGDIVDKNKIIKTISKYNIGSVIHLAAKSIVEESNLKQEYYFKNNLIGTLSILNAMKECKVKKIIFSSTAAVYGNLYNFKIGENRKLSPINTYGLTKLLCEDLINLTNKESDIDYIILRYFNAAGSDYLNFIGENRDPETHLIPRISSCLYKNNSINIYGKNHNTKDGTCVRDFVHVLDIAEAHVISLKYALSNKIKDIFNLGTGKGYSVKQVLETFENLTNKRVKYNYAPKRIGDPEILIANPGKFNSKFNWKANHSSLENIIYSELKWRQYQLKN